MIGGPRMVSESDEDLLDVWLERWEQARRAGTGFEPPADEVGGRLELLREFRRRAAALARMDGVVSVGAGTPPPPPPPIPFPSRPRVVRTPTPPTRRDGESTDGRDGESTVGSPPPGAGPAGPGAVVTSSEAFPVPEVAARAIVRSSDFPLSLVRPDPMVGSELGGYRILRIIGQGGMGTVYEAEDTREGRGRRPGRRVALKTLTMSLGPGSPAAKRFLREIEAVRRLRHPNLVRVYAAGESGGTPFIAMRLIGGGSAADRIAGGRPMRWGEAVRIAADACRGLTAAHAAGVIHRDVKPANILLSRDGTARLADFGIAKPLRPGRDFLTTASGALGTPAFMSPEQLLGDPVDVRSDVYSLGATLHALLHGRPPAPAAGPWRMLLAQQGSVDSGSGSGSGTSTASPEPFDPPIDPNGSGVREPGKRFPDAVAAILARAMAESPADRYATATEMLADLESVLAAAPPAFPVRRPGRTAPRPVPAPPKPAGWPAWAAVLMVAGLAAVSLAVLGLALRKW
jgi:serine/threonine protein kinase